LVFQLPLTLLPLPWRGGDGEESVGGGRPMAYPRHVPPPPEGAPIYFFNEAQKHTPLSCHYFAQRGFRKTNRPLKILGAGGLGLGFSCVASSGRVGH